MQVSLAYLAVLLIWSTTPLAIVWSSETIPPTLAVLLRMIIAVILGYALIMIKKIQLPWHQNACRLYAFSAVGIFGGMTFSYLAAGYLSSGILSLVFGLAPIISSILARKILGEPKLSHVKKFAMLVSIIGLGIVCADNFTLKDGAVFGLLYILFAVFLFSLSGVLVKSISLNINPLATTVGALTVSLPFFIITWFIFDGNLDVSTWETRSVMATVYLGIFGSLIGFYAYFFVLQKLSASTVALVTLITPVVALSLGAYFNNEPLTQSLVIGSSLVLCGLGLYNWGHHLLKKSNTTRTL